MNIVFFINCLVGQTGGAERALLNIASDLIERGHEVKVYTYDRFEGEPFYTFHPRLRIINLRRHTQPYNVDGLGKNTEVVAALSRRLIVRKIKSNLRLIRILMPFLEKRNWLRKNRKLLEELRYQLEEDRPDVVVGFLTAAARIVGVVTQELEIPSMFSLRNDPDNVFHSQSYDFFDRKQAEFSLASLNNYNCISVLTPSFIKKLPQGVQNSAVCLPNFIKSEFFVERDDCPLLEREKVVLCVARFVDIKRQNLLIEAFAKISSKYPDWKLRFVGTGPLKGHLERIVASYELGNWVEFVAPTKQIANEYQNAQIFCLPSKYEGFGQVIGEAMASGMPCVVDAECEALSHLVSEDRGGLAFGVDKARAFADCLEFLIANPVEREKRGQKGYGFIHAYRMDAIMDKWEATLKTLVDNKY